MKILGVDISFLLVFKKIGVFFKLVLVDFKGIVGYLMFLGNLNFI